MATNLEELELSDLEKLPSLQEARKLRALADFRGYEKGLIPADGIRMNVGGSVSGEDGEGAVDITQNQGQVLSAFTPGVWVVCGAPQGYELSQSGGGADPYYPIQGRTVFRHNESLAFRVAFGATPTSDLVLGFYPVHKKTEEDYAKATAQALAFVGYPSTPTDSNSSGTQLNIQSATIKSDSPSLGFTPSTIIPLLPGNQGTVFVNRAYLSDGTTPNTHTIYVSTTDPAEIGEGSAVLPGQSYTFPGGQSFYFIPDGAGSDNMVVEFIQTVPV
jgi:hypothetical protein